MHPKALILLHPGFEEMEAVAPIDCLSRAGVEVIQASVDGRASVTGRSGITLQASCTLASLRDDCLFDAVILPGGPGIQALRHDPALCDLLTRHHQAGKWLACICAAPLLLLDAGLLGPQARYTAHPSTREALPTPQPGRVVRHKRILTSTGAGTATEFALELVKALISDACAKDIAASICWTRDT